jgi:hypothetical protein
LQYTLKLPEYRNNCHIMTKLNPNTTRLTSSWYARLEGKAKILQKITNGGHYPEKNQLSVSEEREDSLEEVTEHKTERGGYILGVKV